MDAVFTALTESLSGEKKAKENRYCEEIDFTLLDETKPLSPPKMTQRAQPISPKKQSIRQTRGSSILILFKAVLLLGLVLLGGWALFGVSLEESRFFWKTDLSPVITVVKDFFEPVSVENGAKNVSFSDQDSR